MEREEAAAMDDYSDSEASEYGLKDLAKLPLLEQVHRLFHAIQHKYPYTETAAWKALPLEQKRVMLQYIRERRAKKDTKEATVAAVVTPTSTSSTSAALAAREPTPASITTTSATATAPSSTRAPPSPASTSVKTDPYLQMLQKRTLLTAPVASSASSGLSHPNSTYAAGQQQLLSQYVENTARRQAAARSRWKVVDAEFYDDPPVCACGVKHEESAASDKSDKSEKGEKALLLTMRAMLSTFGDHTRPCATTVKHVKVLVGAYLRERLSSLMEDGMVRAPCLRTFVEIFAEEAVYYGRWREFRGETKQQEPDLENVDDDELAEELDLFAVSEADAVFNDAFLERIRFADERTRGMDWTIYDSFAKSRKLNFMSHRGSTFRQWLHLGSCSRASLEFMNFVAYHNIGRLVEMAIKRRTGGRLQALESALLKADVDLVMDAFTTEPRYNPTEQEEGVQADQATEHGEPPVKTRRLDDDGHGVPVEPAAPPVASVAATTSESSSSSSSETTGATPQRLTRLKRLR